MRREQILINGRSITQSQINTIKAALINLSLDIKEGIIYNNVMDENNVEVQEHINNIPEIQRMIE